MKLFTKSCAIHRISELHKIISELLEEISDYKIQIKKLLIENSNLKHFQNMQDEKIKELENTILKDRDKIYRKNDRINELHQSQNNKAIEVLNNLKKYFAKKDKTSNSYDIIADYGDILDWIADKINELKK